MKTFYEKTLRNILYLCKFVGIINMSYELQSDGLLIENTDSLYKCLEISRMIILIILSYTVYTKGDFFGTLHVLKLWSVIIASRISESRLIQ